jgi:hypothetical protein
MDSGVVIKMFLKDAVSISELFYVCSFLRGLSRLLDLTLWFVIVY